MQKVIKLVVMGRSVHLLVNQMSLVRAISWLYHWMLLCGVIAHNATTIGCWVVSISLFFLVKWLINYCIVSLVYLRWGISIVHISNWLFVFRLKGLDLLLLSAFDTEVLERLVLCIESLLYNWLTGIVFESELWSVETIGVRLLLLGTAFHSFNRVSALPIHIAFLEPVVRTSFTERVLVFSRLIDWRVHILVCMVLLVRLS